MRERERGREIKRKSKWERERERATGRDWRCGHSSNTWPFGLCKDDSTPCWAESKKLNHLLAPHSLHTGEGARLTRGQPVKRWMTAAVTSFTPDQCTTTWWNCRIHVNNYWTLCLPPSPQSPSMFHSSHGSFYTFTAHLLLLSLTLALFPLPPPSQLYFPISEWGEKSTFGPGLLLLEGSNIWYEACDWPLDLEKSHHLVRTLDQEL